MSTSLAGVYPVCINQEDSDERDEQVRRMKWIYQEAERVVIWLGNYNEPSDNSVILDPSNWRIDRVERNSEAMARHALVLAIFLKLLKQETTLASDSEVSIRLEDCYQSHNFQVWLQLSRLFRRPWFERLWVIQELAVSRKAIVLWGQLQAPWSALEEAAKFILRPGEAALSPEVRKIFPFVGAHRITQVALQTMLNVDTNNVLTVLHNTQNAKCSDPRDRLYAIRGIVEDNQDIEIDYSIPVQHVYRNWAEKRIRRTQTLDILGACADSGRGGELPSWVPDLRRSFGQDKPLWIASQGLPKIFDCGKCDDLCFSEDGLKVNISGKFVGKIGKLTSVGDVVANLPDPTDLEARLRQILAEWERTLKISQPQYSSLDSEGFRETLLRSFYPDPNDGGILIIPYSIWRGGNHTDYFNLSVDVGIWDPSRHEVQSRDTEGALFSRVHGCQMFTTEAGRLGIVAGDCEPHIGDELWQLKGGLTAFVLRRVNETEHRLISPCYLPGKMHHPQHYWLVDSPAQKVTLV